MAKESVLITGGLGYLGSVLTKHLSESGFEVTCLDNLLHHHGFVLNNLSKVRGFNYVYGDVRDEGLIQSILPEFEIIIPLAAIVGMPFCNKHPEDAREINQDAIIMLDRLRNKDQKLVFPNTNSGYGTQSGDLNCTEETPLEPISVYGKTKVEAERHLLSSEKGAVTFRLATIFGMSPRMRTDLLVNDFVLTALTDKEITLYEKDFMRNFVHVKDVARAFEHAILNYDSMKGRPYNVGLDSANVSKLGLAERIKKHVPEFKIFEGDGQDPDKRNYIVSNERIRQTGFECEYDLDYGIEELISGYQRLLKGVSPENLRRPPYRNV